VSDWFFMLGEPVRPSESRQVEAYLRGLGIVGEVTVESVSDWESARRVIDHPEWDRRWWDAEQAERHGLQQRAGAALGPDVVLRTLSDTLARAGEAIHGAAAVAASRRGPADAALIRAAAGAASEALYLSELARLAGAGAEHPFALKQALFDGGHWPLGILHARFYVF
jgi:hypothetical protein